MKVLFDPVYTGRPSTCSTSYLVWKMMEHFAAQRDDVFFYLMVPSTVFDPANEDKTDLQFVSRMPNRVTLLPYPYTIRDRIAEAFKLNDRLVQLLAPGVSPCWDFDVVVSSRLPMLTMMRNYAGRETNFPHGTPRLFLGLDEMPIFSFSDTVAWAPNGNMDLHSLSAYLGAGAVLLNNLWAKPSIQRIARQWLSPSKVMELSDSIHECLPVKLERLQLCELTPVDKELRVAFCGRMTGTRKFEDVAELFRKQYSYPLNKNGVEVKFVISTNSLSTGSLNTGDISFVDVQKNDREKFHALLPQLHVVVNLSHVEDFSLSTYEPLLKGVPVIVLSKPWADFLGPDYPFRVKDRTQAYALISEFARDYGSMYEKFMSWEASYWGPFVAGPRNVTTSERAWALIERHEMALVERLAGSDAGGSFKEIVAACSGDEVDVLKVARDMGRLVPIASPESSPIGKRPSEYMVKLYMHLAGWRDTNQTGIFRRGW